MSATSCALPTRVKRQCRDQGRWRAHGRRARRIVVVGVTPGAQGTCGSSRGVAGVAEREDVFVEDDVTRGDDASGGGVEAAVATVISRVPDEHARRRSGGEFVRRCRDQVGEAPAPEHLELVIRRWNTEEEGVGGGGAGCMARAPINQVHCRGQGLRLERQGSCTVD